MNMQAGESIPWLSDDVLTPEERRAVGPSLLWLQGVEHHPRIAAYLNRFMKRQKLPMGSRVRAFDPPSASARFTESLLSEMVYQSLAKASGSAVLKGICTAAAREKARCCDDFERVIVAEKLPLWRAAWLGFRLAVRISIGLIVMYYQHRLAFKASRTSLVSTTLRAFVGLVQHLGLVPSSGLLGKTWQLLVER